MGQTGYAAGFPDEVNGFLDWNEQLGPHAAPQRREKSVECFREVSGDAGARQKLRNVSPAKARRRFFKIRDAFDGDTDACACELLEVIAETLAATVADLNQPSIQPRMVQPHEITEQVQLPAGKRGRYFHADDQLESLVFLTARFDRSGQGIVVGDGERRANPPAGRRRSPGTA